MRRIDSETWQKAAALSDGLLCTMNRSRIYKPLIKHERENTCQTTWSEEIRKTKHFIFGEGDFFPTKLFYVLLPYKRTQTNNFFLMLYLWARKELIHTLEYSGCGWSYPLIFSALWIDRKTPPSPQGTIIFDSSARGTWSRMILKQLVDTNDIISTTTTIGLLFLYPQQVRDLNQWARIIFYWVPPPTSQNKDTWSAAALGSPHWVYFLYL